MEADIADNAYLEWGEFGGHLYGTKLDSIRDIMHNGRMVILDCSPQVRRRPAPKPTRSKGATN